MIKNARDRCSRSSMIAILSRAKFEQIASMVRADRDHTCARDLMAINVHVFLSGTVDNKSGNIFT